MTPRSPDTLLARVTAAMPDLHPSELRIAQVVIDMPGDLASYSASELARLASVSNATVSRFVRRIGYRSFEDARQAARAEQKRGAPLFRFGSEGASPDGAIAAHHAQARANLDATAGMLGDADMEALALAVFAARRVRFAGFRAGHPMARYLAFQMAQVIEDTALFPEDGGTLAEHVTALGPDDCIIVIALRRPPLVLAPLLAALQDRGTQIAVIGDLPDLQTLPARWRLRCATSAPGPLLNHVAVMAVCNLLAARVFELSGPGGRRRMGTIDDVHRKLDEV